MVDPDESGGPPPPAETKLPPGEDPPPPGSYPLDDALGLNTPGLRQGTFGLGSGADNYMAIKAYVIDPPPPAGLEPIELPLNTDLAIALGREIRLEVQGDASELRWFKTWDADNTLIPEPYRILLSSR